MQIEAQALVSERVNQDPSPSHLPATAWPRRMLAAMYVTQHHLPMGVGRGDYDPPLSGHGGEEERLLALSRGLLKVKVGWWCRLGCRARSFLPRVHLTIFESGVRGQEPPGEEITETVISRDEWYLRVGLSLFGHGRMRTASAGKITNRVILGL